MSQINFNPNIGGVRQTDRVDLTRPGKSAEAPDFGKMLKESIAEANRLQADADKAIEALAAGKTDNVAEVMTAVDKAKLAFETLLQIRNELLEAYDEVRQMRI